MSAMKGLLAALMLAGTLSPSVADARRPPTRDERAAILRQFDRQPYYDGYGRECVAFAIRVSTVNAEWAALTIKPAKRRCRVQWDVESFHRTRGWRSHQLGNGGGCRVPPRVRDDLRLACY